MNSWLALLLACFAAYRLAHDIANYEGPFALYEWVKNRFLKDNWLGRGVRCSVCLSFWTALVFAVIVCATGFYPWQTLVLLWPGIAGASLVIDKYWKR